MSEPEYIDYRIDIDPVVRVTAYPVRGLSRDGPIIRAFFDDARSRLVPGMVMIGGPGLEVYDDRTSLVGFLFALDHIPLPLEEILDWLRDHPLVRVIEVDRSGIANRPAHER